MGGKKIGVFSKTRLETFSDGIFAIIITLLVLEIKVPHVGDPRSVGELLAALSRIVPKIASWVISFFTICVIWVNHHRLFKMFVEFPHGLFWWNAALLLWVSFIPFPTALMGDYPRNPLAVCLYGAVMSMMAFAFYFFRLYALGNPAILHPEVDRIEFKRGTLLAFVFGPLPYLAGAALAWLQPAASFVLYFAIPVYFIFPHATQD